MPLSAAYAADKSPLPLLSDPDRDYYRKIFNYTMDAIVADGSYEWHSNSGMGNISVSGAFVSRSGSTCRNFTETYAIDEKQGGDDGVACKRSNGNGWCRLKKDSALTCAMEPTENIIEEKARDSKALIIPPPKHNIWEDWTPW